MDRRRRALLALALLVPAPSLGALAAFVLWPGIAGQAIYGLCKAWIVAVPVVWTLFVERGPLPVRFPERSVVRRTTHVGLLLGLAMAAAVLLTYAWIGPELVDPDRLRGAVEHLGIATPARFAAAAVAIALINSLLEEYVWRVFVQRRCAEVLPPALAVPACALLFALHHAIVFGVQLGAAAAALATLGVFLAGCAWSLSVRRYGSIWPAWLSHALADLAGLWIGWRLLFA